MIFPELLLLLLPVAAAAGWFAGRRNSVGRSDAYWRYSQRFHRELKHLLAEPSDEDSELLDALSDTQRDTVESHIALGNLYRRRGEMEKALLLHRRVIDKPDLPLDLRDSARFELAQDFRSAGLLDRCEQELRDLLDSGSRQGDACEALLQLHEQQSDWHGAIAVATESGHLIGKPLAARIAHFHCELAAEALKHSDADEAAAQLQQAIRQHRECARALMMQASLAQSAGEHDRALDIFERVESLRPELIPEIIDARFASLKAIGDSRRLMAFVARIREQRNAYTVIRSTRQVIAELHSDALADRFFKDQILRRPSLKGLRDWAHDQVALSKPGERDKVQVICSLLDQVVEDKPAYRCNCCGFQGNVMHWRCPGCGRWDSVSTIIGVEGE